MQELHGIKVPSEEQVTWVTPETTFSTIKTTYVAFCNDPDLEFAYGDLCLAVLLVMQLKCWRIIAATQGRGRGSSSSSYYE
jgi:hypothetical protein